MRALCTASSVNNPVDVTIFGTPAPMRQFADETKSSFERNGSEQTLGAPFAMCEQPFKI
jgi:hypothetical protein